MAIPVPCERCGSDIDFDPDDHEDVPHIKLMDIFIEDDQRHVRKKKKIYACGECRPDIIADMLAAV